MKTPLTLSKMQNKRLTYLALGISLLLFLPYASSTDIIQIIGESVYSPTQIADTYIHTYNTHYTKTVLATRNLQSCTFTNFDCEIGNYSFTLTWPKAGQNVSNAPNAFINDTGTLCVKGGNCEPYQARISVINLNWRISDATSTSLPPFVSPNGYNIIPIGAALLILAILLSRSTRTKQYLIH